MCEIKYLVHCLLIKGTDVTFCLISLHCGLTFNECADRAAKQRAMNNMQSTITDVPLSSKDVQLS